MTKTAKIYLGSPFFNDAQKERVPKAQALLAKNPSVLQVHFPFDLDFVDPNEKVTEEGIRSLAWRQATYQNDINGLVHATCGVFLYDMDQIDDGCAFEIGFMRAMHKPVILVPFSQKKNPDKVMNLMLAQGVTAIIDGNTELEKLAEYDFNLTPVRPVTGYKII